MCVVKNQQTILSGPWTGRPVIEERCGESKRRSLHHTHEEENLMQKPGPKMWRCAGSMLDQLTIGAAGTPTQGLKQKMLQEKVNRDRLETMNQWLVSAELRRFFLEFLTI